MGFYGGLDLARSRDFTALAIGEAIEDDEGEVILRLKGLKVWPHIEYPRIQQDICRIRNRFQFISIGIDATNEMSFAESLKVHGIPIKALKFSAQLKHEMVQDLRLLLSEGKIQLPNAFKGSDLETELKEQEIVISEAGTIRYAHPQGRHDDRFWAVAMMCHIAKPRLLGTLDFGIYRI